jgi:hypothetical protein
MSTTTQEITVGQAYATINASIAQFTYEGVVPSEAVDQITYAISKDVKLRDYLLGLPAEGYTLEECGTFLNYCLSLVDKDKAHPILTILSAYMYESGAPAEFYMGMLDKALELEPEYNLALLLRRVYGAGWSVEAWQDMRSQLHSGVRDELKNRSESVIGVY